MKMSVSLAVVFPSSVKSSKKAKRPPSWTCKRSDKTGCGGEQASQPQQPFDQRRRRRTERHLCRLLPTTQYTKLCTTVPYGRGVLQYPTANPAGSRWCSFLEFSGCFFQSRNSPAIMAPPCVFLTDRLSAAQSAAGAAAKEL